VASGARSMKGFSHSVAPWAKKKLGEHGSEQKEKMRPPSRAKLTIQAMGLKRRPSTACRVKMGRYAVMMRSRAKKTGRCTSWVASRIWLGWASCLLCGCG